MKKIFKIIKNRIKNGYTNKQGMTLVEILIVIAIIAGIMALLIPTIANRFQQSKYNTTKIQINIIKSALLEYSSDNGSYPSTEQGLEALVTQTDIEPVPENFRPGGYLKAKQIKDGWGSVFIYESPTENDEPYEIISYGNDKKEGGKGFAKDIIGSKL